jgi:hypothetical protein
MPERAAQARPTVDEENVLDIVESLKSVVLDRNGGS